MKRTPNTYKQGAWPWLLGVTLLLLTLFAQPVNAQDDINVAPGCAANADFVYSPAVAGTAIAPITIDVVGAGGDPATVVLRSVFLDLTPQGCNTVAPAPPCTVPFSNAAIGVTNISISGTTVTVNVTPQDVAIDKQIKFTLEASTATNSCLRTYIIPVVRRPVDLLLVLDQSGSMTLDYNGNFPPTGVVRWNALKTAVGVFASQLSGPTAVVDLFPDDKVGMVLFSTTVAPASPAPFNVDLTSLQTNAAQLDDALNPPLAPGGMTALGDGILEARDRAVAGTNPRKVMIVFSDGVQNAGDLVKSAGAGAFVETTSAQNISGGGAVDIYTICLGTSAVNSALLDNIATNNDGAFLQSSIGDNLEFETFFSGQLVDIFAGSSPQFIDVRRSSFPASTESSAPVEQAFPVNKGSSAVVVTLYAPSRNEPQITSFSKDGTELIQYATQTRGLDFITIALRPPVTGLPGLTLEGEWKIKMQVTGAKEAVPYMLSIITDDHSLDPTYTIDKKSYKVGDTIKPFFKLSKPEGLITDAEVKALFVKDGDDINHLVALANLNFDISSVDPGSPDAIKLAALLNDPEFLEKIKLKNQIVNLTYDPAQEGYTGEFSGLDVTGIYQLYYRVTATDPVLGKISRFHQKTIYVRFPDVDIPNSAISVSVNSTGNTILNWRPKSSNGRLIGSGWGGGISIEGVKVLNTVDHGDGSYTLTIDGAPGTNVKIHLLDEKVYEGPLENFPGVCKIFGLPCWLFWTLVAILILIILWLIFRKK